MDERQVQRLGDRADVLNRLGRVARVLDDKQWSAVGEYFADDVQFDYGDGVGTQRGIEALRETFTRHLDRCGATQHLLGSIIVTVDGDTAVTEAYVQARHEGAGDLGGEVFDTNGEYVDSWVRSDDGWMIVRRDVHWLTISGNPAVIGL